MPEGLKYSKTNFEIGFYETGQSGVAQVSWNGNTGTFGIAESVPGVSVDPTTGVISWDGDLPLGISYVRVIASNANGNVEKEVTLEHKFSGSFTGGYNFNPNSGADLNTGFNLTFMEDGTMTASDNGAPATGTYIINDNNHLEVTYSYDGTSLLYLDADLHYSKDKTPEIEGKWGRDIENINAGYFKNIMD